MDPKANLLEQRKIATGILALVDTAEDDMSNGDRDTMNATIAESAYRLSELVLALDEWQRKGGFSPYAKVGQ